MIINESLILQNFKKVFSFIFDQIISNLFENIYIHVISVFFSSILCFVECIEGRELI